MTDLVVDQTPGVATAPASYVEWSPILAGAVAAASVSFVLLAFGSAVGLAAISPWSMTPTATSIIGGGVLWFILTQLWAFALGGYISGRMRHRWAGASEDEVHFRDGAHGLLAWATAIVFSVYIGSAAIKAPTNLSVETGNPSVTVALDRLFRVATPASNTVNFAETRAEAGRLLLASQANGLSPGDRTYLSQLVAARTGIPAIDAEARVVTVNDQFNASVTRTRKVGVLLGFLAAASLLVAAATAWWAAVLGGAHRDEGAVWHGFSRNQRLWFIDPPSAERKF